ncbi:MAG: TetR/AcrR family transcriptional regulator [Advenella sp.]|uniref:TetR/AcrR family transcriptional regulator n=1 Tax=Advenella sp. TaxID=1872388 RepID=UPI003F987290
MATSRSEVTRKSILNAAETLFVKAGYDATSLRQITSAASVNLASINYHFGSKEELVRAVLKRRLEWINRERIRLLDELEKAAAPNSVKPSLLVDAFFGTLLRHVSDPEHDANIFMRLLERTMTDPSNFIKTLFAQEYIEVVSRYKAAFVRAMPDVPEAEIIWRFHFMLGATSYAIAGINILQGVLPDMTSSMVDENVYDEQLLPRLMSFLLGGLRAPLPTN